MFYEKRRYSKFRKIQRKTSVPEAFFYKSWKRDSGTGVFLWILQNIQEHLFYRTPLDDSFHFQSWQFQMNIAEKEFSSEGGVIRVFYCSVTSVFRWSCEYIEKNLSQRATRFFVLICRSCNFKEFISNKAVVHL